MHLIKVKYETGSGHNNNETIVFIKKYAKILVHREKLYKKIHKHI